MAHAVEDRWCKAAWKCPDEVANRKPGPVVNSRWLTTANRILRFHAESAKPSQKVMGYRHRHRMIALSRYLSKGILEIVDPVVQRNVFFGHAENRMLAIFNPFIVSIE